MQPDPPAHDPWRNDESFQRLDKSKYRQHEERMLPIAELDERNNERGYACYNGPQERNHRQEDGHGADEPRVGQADNQKARPVEDAVTDGRSEEHTSELQSLRH